MKLAHFIRFTCACICESLLHSLTLKVTQTTLTMIQLQKKLLTSITYVSSGFIKYGSNFEDLAKRILNYDL